MDEYEYRRKYKQHSGHPLINQSNIGLRRQSKYYENSLKRKLPCSYVRITSSHVPRPYQSRDLSCHGKCGQVKRRRSEELVLEENFSNEVSMRLRDSKDSIVEKVVKVGG